MIVDTESNIVRLVNAINEIEGVSAAGSCDDYNSQDSFCICFNISQNKSGYRFCDF